MGQGIQIEDGEIEGVRVMGEPTPYELLDALAAAHRQVDQLMAMIMKYDHTFFPTRTPLWSEIEKRADILKRFGRL